MITVEELIVQSLCHRLIVVNVRRTPDPSTQSHGNDDNSNHDNQAAGPSTSGSVPEFGPGLGILYMGAMSQRARSAMINKTVQQCIEAANKPAIAPPPLSTDTIPEGDETEEGKHVMSLESMALIERLKGSGEEVQFSQEVRTVLETGEMRMMKVNSLLKTEGTQTETDQAGPLWHFGPNPDLELGLPSDAEPAAIDLSRCDSFSIIKLEDTRDPNSRSVVMVQTTEMNQPSRPTELLGTSRKHLETGEMADTTKYGPSPMESPLMLNSHMSVYMREAGAHRAGEQDSGIWEEAKGSESSTSMTSGSSGSQPQQAEAEATTTSQPLTGAYKSYSLEKYINGSQANQELGDGSRDRALSDPDSKITFTIHDTQTNAPVRDESTETFGSDMYVTAPTSFCPTPADTPSAERRSSTLSDTTRLTMALQKFPFEQALPPSPEPEFDDTRSDITIDISDDQTPGMAGLNDIQMSRERGVLASQTQVQMRSGFMASHDAHTSDFSGLNALEGSRPCGVHVRRVPSPVGMRTSSRRRQHQDSGVASIQSLSPGSSLIRHHAHSSNSSSLASMESSFTYEYTDLEESSILAESPIMDLYDVPEYEVFSDWMSELPVRLQEAPITSLVIPGSHISLAIDRDMRLDMDFSKCNYEMADFLRRLPNLAIFNNFRSLMKKIWQSWMPKQMLGIYHQLQAGSRYFDIRITKFRSAFYGEHGLYTRQFKKYLKDMRSFIDEHPMEVIILHFQQLDQLERADKRRLVTILFQVFGAKMARAVPDMADVSIAALWANKKQVIVFFPSCDMGVIRNHIFAGLVWSDELLHLTVPKKQNVTELITYLDSVYTENCPVSKKKHKREKLYVTKAVLSPDMTMVFGEYHHKSMIELMRGEVLPALNLWCAGKDNLNIVAVDFIGLPHLVRRLLELNGPDAIREKKIETQV